MKNIEEVLESIIAEKVLEVGTGTASYTQKLAQFYHHIVTIDNKSQAFEYVKRKNLQHKVRFVKLDVREINFPREHFDLVTGSSIIHHFRDPEKSLESMISVLAIGGKIFIAENANKYMTSPQKNMRDFHRLIVEMDNALGEDHFPIVSPSRWIEIMKKLGIRIIMKQRLLINVPPVEQPMTLIDYLEHYRSRLPPHKWKEEYPQRIVSLKHSIEEYGLPECEFFDLVLGEKQ